MQPASTAFGILQCHPSTSWAARMLTGIRLRFLLGVICHVAGFTGCLRAHNERYGLLYGWYSQCVEALGFGQYAGS